MSPTPQTQSWFWKTSILSALGMPKRSPAAPTTAIARPRSIPMSMSTRLAISIMAMRLVHAAKTRARKKRAWKKRPPGICWKSWGTQMNVSPSLPAPTISE